MSRTDDLVMQLSKGATPKPPLRLTVLAPAVFAVLIVYAFGAQFYLGLRPDLAAQFSNPFFIAENGLLFVLALCGALASLHALYPDMLQRQWMIVTPFIIFSALVVLLTVSGMRDNPSLAMDFLAHENFAGMECTLCIGALSIIPSALLFALLRKGATTRPLVAGAIATLTAAAIGGLVLRLAEPADSSAHFILWHYLPTLTFSGLGALLGKFLLRW